jgi:DNA-binding phage protein
LNPAVHAADFDNMDMLCSACSLQLLLAQVLQDRDVSVLGRLQHMVIMHAALQHCCMQLY